MNVILVFRAAHFDPKIRMEDNGFACNQITIWGLLSLKLKKPYTIPLAWDTWFFMPLSSLIDFISDLKIRITELKPIFI